MAELELPALSGLDPLGFLAGLGAFRLTTDHLDEQARLRWSVSSGTALLTSTLSSLDELADELAAVAQAVPADCVLPGVHAAFPAQGGLTGGDPVRVERAVYRERLEAFETSLGAEVARWFEHIVSDLGEDKTGRAVLTPWMAPSGKQTVRTFFEKSLVRVRAEPRTVYEALAGWRRHDGFTGEYLDHRVLNDAGASVTGQSNERGVPGATWLATMALPALRAVGDGGRPSGTSWRRPPRGAEWVAVWPLWQAPLDRAAVSVVLEHPALWLEPGQDKRARLAALGVFRLGGAKRRQVEGRKSAGVLVPEAVRID